MDRSYAKILARSATNSLSGLANALPAIKEGCPVEEYNKLRRQIASILADIITEILNPLYEEHVDTIRIPRKTSYAAVCPLDSLQ